MAAGRHLTVAIGPYETDLVMPDPVYTTTGWAVQVSFPNLSVTDATALTVSGTLTSQSGANPPVTARSTPGPDLGAPAGLYFLRMRAPEPGDWTLHVTVSGPRGRGTYSTAVRVLPLEGGPNRILAGGILLGGAALAYFYLRRKSSMKNYGEIPWRTPPTADPPEPDKPA